MFDSPLWYSLGAIIPILIFAVVIIAVIIAVSKKKDNFDPSTGIETKENEHTLESQPQNIEAKPAFFDAGSGVVMSGPDFVPQQFMSPWYKAYTGNLKNYYLLDDGKGGSAGLHYNQCSKSCCSDQYPLPFKMPVDSSVCDSKDEFVPTNYTCNNAWQDSGCVCMTKDQANFIGGRGGNA